MSAPTLDKCAAAIAEVRARYGIISGARDNDHGVWQKPAPFGWQFYGNEAECQSWIDREAARACIGALLPVSDELIGDMLPGISQRYYPTATVSRAVVTAAITAVLGEKA